MDERNGEKKSLIFCAHEEGTIFHRVVNVSLKKAYVLFDSLHGPKDTDIDILGHLAKTGLAHQIVLTKLDRAPATLWTEIRAALRDNPTRGMVYKSAVRVLPGSTPSKSLEELEMGVWAPLRGQLGLGCDATVLGVSSTAEWGIMALRCSILTACGAFNRNNYNNDEYMKALLETPIIEDRSETSEEDLCEEEEEEEMQGGTHQHREMPRFEDDNPMRGKVFGGSKMIRQKIYRW